MSVTEPLQETLKKAAPGKPASAARSRWRYLAMTMRVLQVRLRFFVVLVVAFVVVGKWDLLRNYWDMLTRGGKAAETAHPASADTEYYCPMCPGVASDWPSKCPVCNMTLVRHKRGEAVPLPNGVVARMQFSPYRLQLAGIKTSAILYQPLTYEIVSLGVVESAPRGPGASEASVKTEVFEKHVAMVAEGQAVEATSETFAGRAPFVGKVRALAAQLNADSHTLPVWLDIDDPQHSLRPAMSLTVRIRIPAAQFDPLARAAADDWRNRTSVDLLTHALCNPAQPDVLSGVQSLLHAGAEQTMLRRGICLALPQSAIVDTGTRKVVYVETGPGMFDGVEVILGPRCGDFYPVVRGLEAGQRVATTGAFLIDAETQLNRGVAATYFGAARNAEIETPSSPSVSAETQALRELSVADRALALRQKVCPVTHKLLGSMGTPTRIVIGDKIIFLCCEGCEAAIRKNPEKYLSKLHEH